MEDSAGFRIDRTEQPEPLAVDFDDRLIKRDLVRLTAASRLQVALLDPVMNRLSGSVDTQTLQHASRFCQ